MDGFSNQYGSSQPAYHGHSTHWPSTSQSYPPTLYSAPPPAPPTTQITSLLNDTPTGPVHPASYATDLTTIGFPPTTSRPSLSPTHYNADSYTAHSPSSPTYTLTSPASPLGMPPFMPDHRSSLAGPSRGPAPQSRSFSHDSNSLSSYPAPQHHLGVPQQQGPAHHHQQAYSFNPSNPYTPRSTDPHNAGPAPSQGHPGYHQPVSYPFADASLAMMPHNVQPTLRHTSPTSANNNNNNLPAAAAPEPDHTQTLRQLMGSFSSKKRVGPQRKHQCRICQHAFTRPSSVDIHLRSHTGEKPFGCSVKNCDRFFSVLSNARRHERTHQKKEAAKNQQR